MSDDPTLPFGHNTLKLRAVFIPDGAQLSMSDITRVVGFDPVMIRAVWVPKGGALPGYPYELIGDAVFIPDSDDREASAFANRQNPPRMSPSGTASSPALSRTDDPRARDGNGSDGRRWSGSPSASTAGPWAPVANPAGGNGSTGNSAPRRGVRSAQAKFSAAVPTPHVDTSREAIDAAVRALALEPSDGSIPKFADPITLAGWPAPQVGAAQLTDGPDPAKRKLQSARLQAMLRLIRSAENQDDGDADSEYRRLVGDKAGNAGSIVSLEHFPNARRTIFIQGNPIVSTAAGAYQINKSTWDEAVARLALEGTRINDFSKSAQDQVAQELIRRAGAMEQVSAGNVEVAIALLNKRWPSLPGGSQPAHGLTVDEARRRFDRYVTGYLQR